MKSDNFYAFLLYFKWLQRLRPRFLFRIAVRCRENAFFAEHQWFSGRMLACHAGGPGSIPGWCNFLYIFILTFFLHIPFSKLINWLRFNISRYIFDKSLKKVRSEQEIGHWWIKVHRVPSTLVHSTETALDAEFQDALGGCMIDKYV